MNEAITVDRLVAATAGMAAAIYFLASLIAWFRVFDRRPGVNLYAKRLTLNRAFAWSAMFSLFALSAVIKSRVVSLTDVAIDALLVAINTTVFASGLLSVRVITSAVRGNRIFALFGIVSLLAGALIFIV